MERVHLEHHVWYVHDFEKKKGDINAHYLSLFDSYTPGGQHVPKRTLKCIGIRLEFTSFLCAKDWQLSFE